MWSVKNGWHPPVGQFSRKADAQELARQMREANRQAGISLTVKVVKTGANSARRNPTKAQKRLNASKRSKQKRVVTALKKYLQQQNPGTKLAGAKVQKLKGGVIKITPIKVNRGRK